MIGQSKRSKLKSFQRFCLPPSDVPELFQVEATPGTLSTAGNDQSQVELF